MRCNISLIKILMVNILVNGLVLKNQAQSVNNRYENSLDSLKHILEINGKFSKSVFIVENTYYDNTLNYQEFDSVINYLAIHVKYYSSLISTKKYGDLDSINYIANYSIFSSLFDTVAIVKYKHLYQQIVVPYSYTNIDPSGKKDWSNMFVTKLLGSHKGNCHSLTYLYKMLADELKANCWMALAPNHIYIRNHSRKIGWYNTELTSSTFITDAWIATTGYVSGDAIRSGLYMDTLSNQQSIALCVLDLAKGYDFQTQNYHDGFILKCCDLVLQYHAANPMALLLKAETLKKLYLKQVEEKSDKSDATYRNMEMAYITLAKLGYREMPEKMYQQWLSGLPKQKDKYPVKKVNSSKKKNTLKR